MQGGCCSMAQILLRLMVVKLKRKDLRYLVLGAADGLNNYTPLFLGADLLEGSGIPSSNHCRIHARYARKGLATKLIFPAEVAFSGFTNIHSGAWFYNIQGVFQVAFEYHDSSLQVDIVSNLVELWKRRHADPSLPDVIQVNWQQLIQEDDSVDLISQLVNPDSGVSSPSDSNEVSTEVSVSITVPAAETVTRREADTMSRSDTEDATSSSSDNKLNQFHNIVQDTTDRIQVLLTDLNEEAEPHARALLSFLKLVNSETQSEASCDTGFLSLGDLITNFQCLSDDSEKLHSFSNSWGLSEQQNALLCLVSDWLGRKFVGFNDVITKKLEEFKTQNFNRIHDLPSPQSLVPELFPLCMQLLVGHWIGLYDNKTEYFPPQSSRKKTNVLARDDHSYSTSSDDAAQPPTKKSRGTSNSGESSYEDHNYSSSGLGTPSPGSAGDSNPPREDHTYVVNISSEPEESAGPNLPETTRKDHTYVATHSRKSRASPSNLVQAAREERVPQAQWPHRCAVTDSSKFPFVQLILEFVNNALISGVAHVVYTRLLVS